MNGSIQELLQNAYSFVRGAEANKAVAALTLDHLIQQQIDVIQGGDSQVLLNSAGDSTGLRASKLAMLDAIEKGIDQVVQAVAAAGDDPAKLNDLGLDSSISPGTDE